MNLTFRLLLPELLYNLYKYLGISGAIDPIKPFYRRISYALQNFSDIRKAHTRALANDPNERGGGKTWVGLRFLEGRDIESLAIELTLIDWVEGKQPQLPLGWQKNFTIIEGY